MDGWLKLHRSIADHWIYSFKEPDKALAWIDLLIMARHTDGIIMLKGRALELKRGQVGMSQLSMQKRWGWSQNKVKRFLKLLEKHRMCDFETNDLTTVITVCNFDNFQSDGRADERPDERADERTTDDQTDDDIRKKEREKQENTPYQAVLDAYHKQLPMLPMVQKLTAPRKRHIKARWLEFEKAGQGMNGFESLFGQVLGSSFLKDSSFCNLEWITKESNYVKIIEGNYVNAPDPAQQQVLVR